MISEDFPDLFRRMDAMMAQMMNGMESGSFMESFMNMPDRPQGSGYRIVIESGTLPQEPVLPETIRSRDAGEPAAEVHTIGNEVKVIVELPGISEDALRLDVRGDTLVIDAGDGDRHYNTSVKLPAVDPASMRTTLKNGVLEVTFKAVSGASETAGAPES